MHFLILGIWLVVASVVGHETKKDLQGEARDRAVVLDLIRQERDYKLAEYEALSSYDKPVTRSDDAGAAR